MKRWRWLTWTAIAIIVAGCIPKRYEWSPDGKWMTVVSNDGLRIADAQGNLVPGVAEGVGVATWFGDSKRLLVVRKELEPTWNALVPYLSAGEIKAIADAGEHAREALMTYDWTAPNARTWENFTDALKRQEKQAKLDTHFDDAFSLAIGLYVRDHADKDLKQRIPPVRWKELSDLVQPVAFVQICDVSASGPAAGPTLMTTLNDVHELRVSPTGRAALVVTAGRNDHLCNLYAISTDARHPPLQISDAAAWYPDWTPDGRGVVFTRAITPDMPNEDMQLGSLSRVDVIDDRGNLAGPVKEAKDLVGLLYSSLTRVRCLKDGRIIFLTAGVTLPATNGDMPVHAELFVIDPSKQQTVSRLLSADFVTAAGNSAQYFEVSPDETRISIPDDSGKVTVVDLAKGTLSFVQDKPVTGGLLTVPAWRTGDELTLIAPGADGHPKVVLWSVSANHTRTLSGGWPLGLVDDKATSRPTTAP